MATKDTVTVYFKELDTYKRVTLKFFDRYLHAGLITHTNHFGWFCNKRSLYDNQIFGR